MMNSLEMNNIEEIKTLNPYQQEAVLDESPACLVNANVGSGKTTVLIEKVRHLHEKKQVSYEKMAVLTFTKLIYWYFAIRIKSRNSISSSHF